MKDISISRALFLPTLLTAVMISFAATISQVTGVSGARVFPPYLSTWAVLALISVPIWAFIEVARMAAIRADDPVREIVRRIYRPMQLAVLSGIIFPLFLGGYTWAKYSIAMTVGYGWERVWADADHLLLGMDAWKWAHTLFPSWTAAYWTYFYAVVWGFAFAFSGVIIAACATRRFAATFFTAMMLSWLIGGVGLAYAISAAGPIFAHLVDPELGLRFEPLRTQLSNVLSADDLVLMTQRYLAAGMGSKVALKGGGISAMPSMHIATATMLVLAAWKTRWLAPAIAFLLLTFIGSIYLGYHYAVDAPIATFVAVVCWFAARRIFLEPAEEIEHEIVGNLIEQPIS